MKIKLNAKQLEQIRRELADTDRKRYDISEVDEVFRMLQYWSKSVGGGETKIQSVAELADGCLCRVNQAFHEKMKRFLKETRARRHADYLQVLKKKKMENTVEMYDQLIKEAEENKHLS